jgi:hypothetical protein
MGKPRMYRLLGSSLLIMTAKKTPMIKPMTAPIKTLVSIVLSFHSMDRMIRDSMRPRMIFKIRVLAGIKNPV